MLITFSGVDGAGKTTQIDLFTEFLKKQNYDFKQITMYDDISISAFIRQRFNAKNKRPSKEMYRNDKNRKDFKIVCLRKIAYIFDLIVLIGKKFYYEND